MKPAAIKHQRCAIYTRVSTDNGLEQILCGWTAAGLGRLSFHTSMEATDAIYHLRDRCRDRRPGE